MSLPLNSCSSVMFSSDFKKFIAKEDVFSVCKDIVTRVLNNDHLHCARDSTSMKESKLAVPCYSVCLTEKLVAYIMLKFQSMWNGILSK